MSNLRHAIIATERDRISSIITNKIEEHKLEIVGSDKAITQLQKSLKSETTRPDFNKVQHLGILKDKIIFHKACAAVLADLLETITGEASD